MMHNLINNIYDKLKQLLKAIAKKFCHVVHCQMLVIAHRLSNVTNQNPNFTKVFGYENFIRKNPCCVIVE